MRVPVTRSGTAVLLGLIPVLAAATPANPVQLTLQPQSTLTVSGTSTVRSFSCAATAFTTDVTANGTNAIARVLAGEKAVAGAEFSVAAAQLDCRNGTMNDHMRKALKAVEHPTIAFRLTDYESARAEGGARGTVTGVLSLGGVQKTITMTGAAAPADGGALRVTGAHELNMKDYGLKPPTLMLGTMKVGDKVTVAFDLLLKD